MKLIILEGIPTSGKTVLGKKISNFLKKNLDKKKFEIFYFNDDIRNEFEIDVLDILKKQDKSKMNPKSINSHLGSILERLEEVESKKNKECIFVVDRFHFSYLSNKSCKLSDFGNLEKKISSFTYYILLNFKDYDSNKVFDRLKSSIELRGKSHGFTKHFERIISDKSKGKSPEDRISSHYLSRYKVYEKSFRESKLMHKKKIEVDKIVREKDYDKVLKKTEKELLDFVLGKV